jgi:hypothetical protein
MFRLRGRKREAKETGSKSLEESQGVEVVEDKGDGERLGELMNDLVEERSTLSSASVRSIIKAAINSAEQIVDNVKTRVAAEARQEAEKIIAEAKKEAEKIKRGKTPAHAVEEAVAVKEEEAVAMREEEAVTVKEEAPVQLQEEVVAPAAEETAPQEEEPAAVEPVAEKGEPEKAGKQEQKAPKKESEIIVTKEESQSLYTGEVELTIGVPVEPTMVANLYSYLQTSPEIKFVRTTGSWNRGSTITIVLDKPIPLISVLAAKLPLANVVPERPVGSGHVKDRRGMRKINISLKDK